jgi:hypothetical protein
MFGLVRGPLRCFSLAVFISFVLLTGCRSPYVETTVRNSGSTELHNIEIDYPSASFGISNLAPGEAFHYRFQLRDTGRMKVQFFDDAKKSHSGVGPYAAEGQHGTLAITLDGSGKNVWAANLHPFVPTPKSE